MTHNHKKFYFYKTTFCGNSQIEELQVHQGQLRGYDSPPVEKKPRCSGVMTDADRSRSLQRTRKALRLLTKSNYSSRYLFVTFTYKENVLDYVKASNDFRKMMQHIKRSHAPLPYFGVVEHQKKRGLKNGDAGALHFHVLFFKTTFIPHEILNHWRYKMNCGSVNFPTYDIASPKRALSYLMKYIRKDVKDRPYNKKRYYCPRIAMIRPTVKYSSAPLDKPYFLEYYVNTSHHLESNKTYTLKYYKKI